MKIHLSVIILREQNKANHQIRATVHLIWPGQYNQAFFKKKVWAVLSQLIFPVDKVWEFL